MRNGILALVALLAIAGAAQAQSLANARGFVAGLYDAYAHSDPDYLGRQARRVFSPRLLALIRRDARDAHGEVGALDGDPICDCQDWGKTGIDRLDVTSQGVGRATAKVRFRNQGQATDLTLDLVSFGGRWRIDDIHTNDTPSLVRYLQTHSGGK